MKIAGINFDHFHMGDLLRLVAEHPGAEIVGISDEQPERMVEATGNFGLSEAQVFTDYRQCLEKTKPDMVILCPAAARHAEWTEKVADYELPILMEKPFAADLAQADRMIAAMEKAGLKAPVRDNIRDDIWIKLWGNLCFNPISALTGATLDIVATDTATRILSRCMMIEAQAIGEALGAHFRVDVHRRINGAAEVGPHKTSMLQDLEKGRAMEIDALVTAVQEMGRLVDIETPYIDTVLGLIQQRGRMLGLYPTFAGPDLGSDAGEDERHLVD